MKYNAGFIFKWYFSIVNMVENQLAETYMHRTCTQEDAISSLEDSVKFSFSIHYIYSATEQESRFLPLCGFCSVLWLNLHVS